MAGARRLVVGALVVDRYSRKAFHAGTEVWLSRLEFDLLAHLAAAPTRVVTKSELLREVWGLRSDSKTRTVDAHACRMRRKLALARTAPDPQHTGSWLPALARLRPGASGAAHGGLPQRPCGVAGACAGAMG
jgi:hypothetical protein